MSELLTDRFTRTVSGSWGDNYQDDLYLEGTAAVNGSYGTLSSMGWYQCRIPAGAAGIGTIQFDFYVPTDPTDGGNLEGNYIYYKHGWPKSLAPGLGAGWYFNNYLEVFAWGDGTWAARASSSASVTFTPEAATWYTAKALLFTPGSSSRTVNVSVWKRGEIEPGNGDPGWDSGTSATGNSPSFDTDMLVIGGAYTGSTRFDNLRVWNEIVLITEEPTYAPPKPDPTVTVQIKYDGVDITDDCVVAECWFTARANGYAGEAQVVIKDTAQLMTFIPGSTLELFLDGVRQWDGYAMARKHNYWFEGHTANCYPCPHITPRKHILVGADRNILFERRVLYNKAAPAEGKDNIWPAGTLDEDVIEQSIVMYLDDVDGIDYTTKVETVAAVDPYVQFRVPGPTSMFGHMLREISQAVGAVFYIDPDRYLVYTDVNHPDAPFVLTDKPEVVGEVGYREMTVMHDGSQMVNDAMIWGAGQGSPNITFSRVDDTDSISTHGRYQNPNGYRVGVWTQGSVDRIADSIVYGSPSERRGHKDDQVSVDLVLHTPGLRVAQKVDFTNHAHDFTDVIPIRNLRISFPTPYNVRYEVGLSHELDEPWSIVEPWEPEGREYKDPPGECTKSAVEDQHGIWVIGLSGEQVQDGVTPTHIAQRGTIDSYISILHGDGYPPNKQWFYGNNDYLGFEISGGDPFVEYYQWYSDMYWYNSGDGGLQVPGDPIWQYRNRYEFFITPENTLAFGYPVIATFNVTLSMSGTMAERDITGHLFPFPSITRDGVEPAWPHYVMFGFIQPQQGHWTAPATTPEAFYETVMSPGESESFTYSVMLPSMTAEFGTGGGRFYYGLGVDFWDIPDMPKPWISDVQVTSDVTVSYEMLHPHSEVLFIQVPPDEDGNPCAERNSLGRRCEDAVRLNGLVFRLRNPYAYETLVVSVDGFVLAGNGIQYTETSPARGEFTLNNEPGGVVYVCYDASAYSPDLPPPEVLFLIPVDGPITGSFGAGGSGWGDYVWHGDYYEHFHNGVDFGVPIGTPVYAAAAGRVRTETQDAGGIMVHIYHDFYGFRTTYAHLDERLVEDGDEVLQGQIIGYSGETGNVTGPHLHWGLVVDGSPENPLTYTDYQAPVKFYPTGPGIYPI